MVQYADISVELIDHMGSDLSAVNAARVSFAKQSAAMSEKDEGLIRYLAAHNHWTPFGHCFASFRIKAPIFVARQLFKHQVGLVANETSRRYVDDEPEFYLPDWRERAENIKQGSGGMLMPEAVEHVSNGYDYLLCHALSEYQDLLTSGVAPEQARMVLPLGTMTEWIWSGSLAAWARVCCLRLDSHAQEETKQVAAKIADAMAELFPVSWRELVKGE